MESTDIDIARILRARELGLHTIDGAGAGAHTTRASTVETEMKACSVRLADRDALLYVLPSLTAPHVRYLYFGS